MDPKLIVFLLEDVSVSQSFFCFIHCCDRCLQHGNLYSPLQCLTPSVPLTVPDIKESIPQASEMCNLFQESCTLAFL